MFKKIKVNLPSNPTVDEKSAAIELILDEFIDKRGRFDITAFSRSFRDVQRLVNDNIPDWQSVVVESPIYADDVLSGKFVDILSSNNPKSTDFVELAHQMNEKEEEEGVKQFSSVQMHTTVPPLNEEIIVYHPGFMCCVQGMVDEVSDYFIHVDNLSIGGDFSVPIKDIKWLPADRFNPVKTTDNITVHVDSVKKFSNTSSSHITELIRGYLED